ncbi:DNA starvation/stationary phase protection protein [Nocardioides dubius]|uniref:DNA starvation/stationary phase protection protein n=1 Tax=Nocardioides dubius TaxID=317019 RepID=A0ABN1U026_9ACTN
MTDIAHATKHVSRPAFKASPALAANLQAVLVDLTDLHLQGKQAHWNIVGPNFRDLHLALDEVVDAARDFADTVAERMRALYALPDGRSSTVSLNTSLAEFPAGEVLTSEAIDLIVDSLYRTAGTARRVHDEVDAEDPTSADILHTILERLEQLAWMIDAENRNATSSEPRPVNG